MSARAIHVALNTIVIEAVKATSNRLLHEGGCPYAASAEAPLESCECVLRDLVQAQVALRKALICNVLRSGEEPPISGSVAPAKPKG